MKPAFRAVAALIFCWMTVFCLPQQVYAADVTQTAEEILLARVWGYDSNAVENHVEVYIGFLRKKLQSIGSNVRIVALRRLGYHLEVAKEC